MQGYAGPPRLVAREACSTSWCVQAAPDGENPVDLPGFRMPAAVPAVAARQRAPLRTLDAADGDAPGASLAAAPSPSAASRCSRPTPAQEPLARPGTAGAPREELLQKVYQERAINSSLRQKTETLCEQVGRLTEELECRADELDDLKEEHDVAQRALRARTDGQKHAERDARLQATIYKVRLQESQQTSDDLARRLEEARRETLSAGQTLQDGQMLSSLHGQRDPSEVFGEFRQRLMHLLSLGAETSPVVGLEAERPAWAEDDDGPTQLQVLQDELLPSQSSHDDSNSGRLRLSLPAMMQPLTVVSPEAELVPQVEDPATSSRPSAGKSAASPSVSSVLSPPVSVDPRNVDVEHVHSDDMQDCKGVGFNDSPQLGASSTVPLHAEVERPHEEDEASTCSPEQLRSDVVANLQTHADEAVVAPATLLQGTVAIKSPLAMEKEAVCPVMHEGKSTVSSGTSKEDAYVTDVSASSPPEMAEMSQASQERFGQHSQKEINMCASTHWTSDVAAHVLECSDQILAVDAPQRDSDDERICRDVCEIQDKSVATGADNVDLPEKQSQQGQKRFGKTQKRPTSRGEVALECCIQVAMASSIMDNILTDINKEVVELSPKNTESVLACEKEQGANCRLADVVHATDALEDLRKNTIEHEISEKIDSSLVNPDVERTARNTTEQSEDDVDASKGHALIMEDSVDLKRKDAFEEPFSKSLAAVRSSEHDGVSDQAINYRIGERVQRRDIGKEWIIGYVTSVTPLKVTVRDDPKADGYTWDEVRKIPDVENLAPSEAINYRIGERVQRRDVGKDWVTGYVTSLTPLRVTVRDDPKADGYMWDEVRKMPQVNSDVEHEMAIQAKAAKEETQGKAEDVLRTHVEDEEANAKIAEEVTRIRARAEKEARVKAEAQAKVAAVEEARLNAEEDAKTEAEKCACAQAEEDAKVHAVQMVFLGAEEEARSIAEAEQKIKAKAEREARSVAEYAIRLKTEEDAKTAAEQNARAQTEDDAKKQAEQVARLRADEESQAKARAESEAWAKAVEDAKSTAREEARLKAEESAKHAATTSTRAKTEEDDKVQARQLARLRAEEEIGTKSRAVQEAWAVAEEEARAAARKGASIEAEENARISAENNTRAKTEEDAKAQAERKAVLRAEEETRAKARAEEDARTKAEDETKAAAEEKARLNVEENARAAAEKAIRAKAEEDAAVLAEQEARLNAEEKAKEQATIQTKDAKAHAEEEARLKVKENAQGEPATEARKLGCAANEESAHPSPIIFQDVQVHHEELPGVVRLELKTPTPIAPRAQQLEHEATAPHVDNSDSSPRSQDTPLECVTLAQTCLGRPPTFSDEATDSIRMQIAENQLRRQHAVRKGIAIAVKKSQTGILKSFILEAESAGLDAKEIQMAKDSLATMDKPKQAPSQLEAPSQLQSASRMQADPWADAITRAQAAAKAEAEAWSLANGAPPEAESRARGCEDSELSKARSVCATAVWDALQSGQVDEIVNAHGACGLSKAHSTCADAVWDALQNGKMDEIVNAHIQGLEALEGSIQENLTSEEKVYGSDVLNNIAVAQTDTPLGEKVATLARGKQDADPTIDAQGESGAIENDVHEKKINVQTLCEGNVLTISASTQDDTHRTIGEVPAVRGAPELDLRSDSGDEPGEDDASEGGDEEEEEEKEEDEEEEEDASDEEDLCSTTSEEIEHVTASTSKNKQSNDVMKMSETAQWRQAVLGKSDIDGTSEGDEDDQHGLEEEANKNRLSGEEVIRRLQSLQQHKPSGTSSSRPSARSVGSHVQTTSSRHNSCRAGGGTVWSQETSARSSSTRSARDRQEATRRPGSAGAAGRGARAAAVCRAAKGAAAEVPVPPAPPPRAAPAPVPAARLPVNSLRRNAAELVMSWQRQQAAPHRLPAMSSASLPQLHGGACGADDALSGSSRAQYSYAPRGYEYERIHVGNPEAGLAAGGHGGERRRPHEQVSARRKRMGAMDVIYGANLQREGAAPRSLAKVSSLPTLSRARQLPQQPQPQPQAPPIQAMLEAQAILRGSPQRLLAIS